MCSISTLVVSKQHHSQELKDLLSKSRNYQSLAFTLSQVIKKMSKMRTKTHAKKYRSSKTSQKNCRLSPSSGYWVLALRRTLIQPCKTYRKSLKQGSYNKICSQTTSNSCITNSQNSRFEREQLVSSKVDNYNHSWKSNEQK